MITPDQYVGTWASSADWDSERQLNASILLMKCSDLETEMIADGVGFPDNPITKSGVSGETYGGFRPQSCPIGAPNSNHKKGFAVDRYDPYGLIDAWCMAHQDKLRECGVFIEHPDSTPGWSHWASVPPPSGKTVFYP
jgi:hypothetical protein